ncbi:MAG: type II toxin-antitoxin system HicA family toxin [Dehalococcoidia bacterium]|jgi:predicted RNA binding protein YcfA (HicA-like mRNA interferase family)|nr:type II toxin-antitoxin system HicA family toxin [Dehalococcoidia bacterium]
MTRLPRVSGTDVVRALERDGFSVVRRKGSHAFLRHADGRTTVVPLHSGETIGPGLLSKILRDAALDQERFERLLQ